MHKLLQCACGENLKDHANLALRIVTGLIFFFHGYDKVFIKGVENVIPFFSNSGIPMANIATYLVSYGELLGGLALIIGFMTHWVAKLNILIMLGAIGFVHWGAEGGWFWGFGAQGGYEYQLLILVVSFYFLVNGAGKWSVDAKLKNKQVPSSNVM